MPSTPAPTAPAGRRGRRLSGRRGCRRPALDARPPTRQSGWPPAQVLFLLHVVTRRGEEGQQLVVESLADPLDGVWAAVEQHPLGRQVLGERVADVLEAGGTTAGDHQLREAGGGQLPD